MLAKSNDKVEQLVKEAGELYQDLLDTKHDVTIFLEQDKAVAQ